MDVKELFKGFSNRMESFFIYKPIFELERKEKYHDLPLSSIGLAILLFILENMLRYEKKNTYNDIARFLQEILKNEFNREFNYEEIYDFTLVMVREFLRNNGQPFVYKYYCFETHMEKEKTFHLIDFDMNYDLNAIATKNESFILTPVTIEGLFKTREIFQEMQITIMQLYFRQQIQRKVFDGAIQTVEEIIFTIQNRYNQMADILKRISKDVLQIARENEFERMMDSYERTLNYEKEVFGQLKELINYTLEEYYKGEWTKKEEKAIRSIRHILRRWNDAIIAHEKLFTLKQDVQSVFADSMEEVMFQSFQTTINFEREVIPLIIENQVGLEGLTHILNPLNPMKPIRMFHPGYFFEPQKRKVVYETSQEEALPELTPEEKMLLEQEERKERNRSIGQYKKIISTIITPLTTEESYNMKQYIHTITDVTTSPLFYIVLVQIHQRRHILFEPISKELQIHLDEFGQALAEFLDETDIYSVCQGAEVFPIDGEWIELPDAKKSISNLMVRRIPYDSK
jgi:hypothetical protein